MRFVCLGAQAQAPGFEDAASGPGGVGGERVDVPGRWPSGLAVRLRTGQLLYGAGQTGDAVFVLHRGLVKETLEADEGERVVRLVGASGLPGQGSRATFFF